MTDWSQVLAEYGGIVWKTVRRLVNDDADAADCFQETFVAAWEFSRKRSVQNWPGLLKRLATARALDQLRKRMRTAVVSLPAEATTKLSGQLPPPAAAEENELFDQLRAELAALPSDQAEVCCLRFLESFSYEQIADELGLTINHVGVLLHRAKSALQNSLAAFAPTGRNKREVDS